MKEPKILIWDIETSLNIVTSFTLFPKYIPHENILQDWYIICGAWKFLGEDTVHAVSALNDKERFSKDFKDDYHVVKTLRDVLLKADLIVHHNGDKFDLRKLNTRLIYHRLDPLPNKLVTVDTLKEARRTFNFTSNRLDYLGGFLEVGRKVHSDSSLWLKSLKGDKKAIREMVTYNKGDVTLLEDIYNVMKPYIKHPNLAAISGEDLACCVVCKSTKLEKRGFLFTTAGKKQRYQCLDCRRWNHSPSTISKTVLRPA
jgi:DNA polymerase elongation subunit (family B)